MQRLTISIPEELLRRLDEAAAEAGLKRSQALQAAVLRWLESVRAAQVREQIGRYYAKHPEELEPDEENQAWREYQRSRMAQEYGEDEW